MGGKSRSQARHKKQNPWVSVFVISALAAVYGERSGESEHFERARGFASVFFPFAAPFLEILSIREK
jgi:hypothetical protein